jgi:hypothetical protein
LLGGAPVVASIWLTSPSASTFQMPLDDCLSPLDLMGLNSDGREKNKLNRLVNSMSKNAEIKR